MTSFGKKCKKRLRKLWYSTIFSCFSVHQKNENIFETAPSAITSSTNTEDLQHLLIRLLQSQLEDRQFYTQVHNTLLSLTNLVKHLSTTGLIQTTCISSGKMSKFAITNFKNTSNQCTTNLISSMTPSNTSFGTSSCQTYSRSTSSHILDSHSVSKIFPNGEFGFDAFYKRPYSHEKAIQSTLLNLSSLTKSKLIQTNQFVAVVRSDLVGFKISLIKHIQCLREDVVTLRTMLFSVENYGYYNGSIGIGFDRRKGVGVGISSRTWQEEEFEYKFSEAKVRAANFAKFYKLRKVADKNKNKTAANKRKTPKNVPCAFLV